ncbi:MAG TPA: Fic family protein [Acidimicrobiales bacterium]|nr:Fic family protein [Acidimicrobiales bacterium]
MTLRRSDRAAGAEGRYADQLPQLLDALREQARVESITASSAIEGVIVDDARVPKLVSGATGGFRNCSEAEFAGYSSALDYLNQNNPGDLSVGLVLHLHRLLFSFTEGRGGHFKTDDNLVVDRLPDGSRAVRFGPVGAAETPFFMEELVARSVAALQQGWLHPLIATAAFALDFLCIHPFADGNGRVARLATTYLMGRTGYGVGRYVSLEQLIYDTKDDYYGALGASTTGWFDDGHHDVWPWARYLLGRVGDAYGRFEERIAAGTSGGTKQDRVRDYVLLHAPATFTIAEIRRAVPGVSDNTIRIVLGELKEQGSITNDGSGRGAAWRRL